MAGSATDETDIDCPAHSQHDFDPDGRARLQGPSLLIATGEMEVVGETDLAPCARAAQR